MKNYYPSYLSKLKPFLILILFSLYFFMSSIANTFEFYLWGGITIAILCVKMYRLKNRMLKPVLSIKDGFIITDEFYLGLRSIDKGLIIKIIVNKDLINFKLISGQEILVKISSLSNRDKKCLLKDINLTYKEKVFNK
ncbi:hypothetical protein BMR05_14315 [Methylococcaceae bacterium HT4]|nr:hypothetical protein BMR05_14315 [Methylococcaceae bacterium HT4]TXL18959.1 hypothetical protein BMR03_15605 [Methylococcaceae bacterium HT2]